MSDFADVAGDYQEKWEAGCIAAALPAAPVGPSRFECLDCDGPIPERRRQAVIGCQRCIECESLISRPEVKRG